MAFGQQKLLHDWVILVTDSEAPCTKKEINQFFCGDKPVESFDAIVMRLWLEQW